MRRTPILHPDTKTLLAYQDRELNRRRTVKVGRHVARCERCRTQLADIEAGLRRLLTVEFTPMSDFPQIEKVLENLMVGIRISSPELRPRVRSRVVAEIERFFGSRTAIVFKSMRSQSQGTGTLAAAEPLFALFLGRRAAAALTSRILDGVDTRPNPTKEVLQ